MLLDLTLTLKRVCATGRSRSSAPIGRKWHRNLQLFMTDSSDNVRIHVYEFILGQF